MQRVVFLLMVRVEGVEPSSHAWEAYIIAVIRYPRWLYYSTLQGKRLTIYCEVQGLYLSFARPVLLHLLIYTKDGAHSIA